MPVLTLLNPHTHAGQDLAPGDYDIHKLGLTEAEAEWLISLQAASWKKPPKKKSESNLEELSHG